MADSPRPPDEPTYHEYVRPLLEAKFGAAHVSNNVYLSKTGRECDYLVRTGLVTLAIEVETSSDRIIDEGLSQARLYAQHYPTWVPVLIYPPDGETESSNAEELAMLQQVCPVVPIPYLPNANPTVNSE